MRDKICVSRNPVDGKFYAASIEDGGFREAQLVTPEDISTIEAQVVLDEVLGFAAPERRLRALCRVIPSAELTFSIDVGTLRTGTEKVPPMVEAPLKADAYERVPFDLWKNVDHLAFSDEAAKRAQHAIATMATQNSGKVMAKMENSQISTILTGITNISGSDWGTKSGGISTYNPIDDIAGAVAAIEALGYRPDSIAMHPLVWADFIGNTYIQNMTLAGMVKAGEAIALPSFPTMRLTIDSDLTNTVCYVLDSSAPAVVFGDGPTEAEKYRHAPAGFTGYVVRQWLEPKLSGLADAARELTGVHA